MRTDRPATQEESLLLTVREPVRRFLNRLLAEPALAEDAESETVLTLIQRLRSGLQIRRPVSFALQVAWSKAVEMQRRATREPPVAAPRPAVTNDPARMTEVRDWLDSGLAALEPVDRALLHLRYVEDLSYRELSRVLDEPIGTIGRRLHEARFALKRNLEKTGGEEMSESTLGALLPLLRTLVGPEPHSARAPLPRWTGAAARFTTTQKLFLCLGVFLAVGSGTWLVFRSGARFQDPGGRLDVPAAAPRTVADAGRALEPSRPDAPPRAELAIAGRVVDETGLGVAAAAIQWFPWSERERTRSPVPAPPPGAGRVTAGPDGAFRLEAGPDQTLLDLVATAPGFAATRRDSVRIGVADVVLRLGPGLAIGGVIADLQGNAVANARVTYHARVGEHPVEVTTRSSRDGRYDFEHLPIDPSLSRPDAGVIEIAAAGHATQLKPVGMALPGDASRLALDVWLARGAVLEGTVRDESGATVADATVEVWLNAALELPTRPGFPVPKADPIEARRILETRTDSSGRYRLEHAPVRVAGIEPGGRYGLFKKEHPFIAGGLVVSAPGRAPRGAPIPLASEDEAVVTVDVALRKEIVLTGSVHGVRDEPVTGAEVAAFLRTDDVEQAVTSFDRIRGSNALATAVTDSRGNWTLAGLPSISAPGRLEIAASARGRATTRLTLDGVNESRAIPTLVLAEARRIRGIVVDEVGSPLAGAVVAGAGAATATDREGAFEIAGPAPSGGLDLRVEALRFARASLRAAEDPGDAPVRVAMARERILRGTIRSAEGRVVAGAVVTAVTAPPGRALTHAQCESDPSLALAETTTDATGAFTLEGLPPSPVALWAGVPWPRNDGLMGMLFGRKFAVVVPEPAAPGPCVVTIPYRAERGSLVVKAVDAKSKAPILHDLAANLTAADGMIGGFGMFAGPGLLVFHSVPAGTYDLAVEARGFPRITTAKVTIGDPASPPERSVELVRGGRIAGRVRHEGSLPPGGVFVSATADPKVPPLRMRCGDDGSFALEGLTAGSWRVWAELQETGQPPVMTTRPEIVVLDLESSSPPAELRLVPIQQVRLRISGLFAEGDAPTMDKQSPRYGDLIRRIGEFRLRCRDDAGVTWLDRPLDGITFETAERDVILHLPLPSGSYEVALDRGDDEIESRRIASPGAAEISVPAN